MIFPGYGEFFEHVGTVGACSTRVPMEEVYQHFKARLLAELSNTAHNSASVDVFRVAELELDKMRERGEQG